MHQPKAYQAIMVSSTFTDLKEHRHQIIEAIEKLGYRANVMEFDGARADVDVIESSLEFVRDSAAYVGVISHKYGQTPYSPERNPDRLSITELEFNEAMRLGRPILLFIMGENHLVTEADIELDPEKRKKLGAFRERAKRMREGSEVERVYQVFDSLEQFSRAAAIAIGRLAKYLVGTPRLMPAGPDRLRLALYVVLDQPAELELLDRLDESELAAVWQRLSADGSSMAEVLRALAHRHGEQPPQPLCSAWIETVQPDKLGK